jgi:recombination protein RecA
MAISPEALKVVRALNKKLGDDTVIMASDITQALPRVTSGSLALDVALGGGWPTNQWVELIGEHSHGKTFVVLTTIAANQRRDPNFTTVWIAAEEWVADWAVTVGVDLERVIVVETNIMEEAYDAAIAFAESRGVDAIIIDSYPALVPLSEDEKEIGEATVGRGALLTGKFFRKMSKAMKRSLTEYERPVLGILINQWRSKIGVMYGDPRTTPGGQAKDYACFVRAEVKRDGWLELKVEGEKDKRKIGQGIKVITLKNKTYPPRQTAFFDMYFAEGGPVAPGQVDFGKEYVALGILTGVIQRGGGGYYSFGGQRWKGGDAALAAIREDIDLAEQLEKEVLTIITHGKVAVVSAGDDDEE